MEHIEINYRRPRPAVKSYSVEFKPTLISPETFNPRKGILTRYGKKLLQEGAKYYSHVSLGPLGTGVMVHNKPPEPPTCPVCDWEKSRKKESA